MGEFVGDIILGVKRGADKGCAICQYQLSAETFDIRNQCCIKEKNRGRIGSRKEKSRAERSFARQKKAGWRGLLPGRRKGCFV